MFQIIFNDTSAAEMAALPKDLQIEILTDFQFLPGNFEDLDATRFGKVKRDKQELYRFRARDYHIYFGPHPSGILIHRVLHKNTIRDFLFRSNLPLDEDEQLGQAVGFWKLIEAAGEKQP